MRISNVAGSIESMRHPSALVLIPPPVTRRASQSPGWRPLKQARKYRTPGAITGFEAFDVRAAIVVIEDREQSAVEHGVERSVEIRHGEGRPDEGARGDGLVVRRGSGECGGAGAKRRSAKTASQ